jgi:alpha-L-arabinofuranosidase
MFSTNLGDQVVKFETSNIPTQLKKPNARDSVAGVQPKMIPAMFFSVTKNTKAGIIYLKVVNSTATAQKVKLDIQGVTGVASKGTAITLKAASTEDTNTITEPEKIVPVTTTVKGLGKHSEQSFPAYSITVLQMQTK